MKTVLRTAFAAVAALPVCYGQAVISTVAGDAIKAGINLAFDVAIDGAGSLYIVEGDSNRVARSSPAGAVLTVKQ